MQYIGSSKKGLKKSWSDHKRDVKETLKAKRNNKEDNTKSTLLASHFRDVYHDIEDNVHLNLPLKVTIIDSGKDKLDMRHREAYWISKLGTLKTECGLNRQQAAAKKAWEWMEENSDNIDMVMAFAD